MKASKISAIAVLLSFLSFFILTESVQAKYSGGSGTAGDPYQISTAVNLLALAAEVNDYNKCFILTADIDLGSLDPCTTALIAPDTVNSNDAFDGTAFTGVFDGSNHTISNLIIDTNGAKNDYLGLFGQIGTGGQIKNLGLEDVNITGDDNSIYLGGLVGWNEGSISDCYSTGDVSGGDSSLCLGGLVGRSHYGSISNCYSTGDVSGGDSSGQLGGLAGDNGGTISNCYSTGAVSGGSGSADLGGLVGYNYDGGGGTISDCHSTGNVIGGDGSQWLGGLAGYNNDGGSISNCYSTGTVTGEDNSGYLGGLVGWNYNGGNISDCYSTGDVSGGDNSGYLGGLAGYNEGSISNCYSIGAVTGESSSSYLGGLIGDNLGSISNCYSTGNVTGGNGSYYLGGLVGDNKSGSSISNCYSTGSVTGGDSSLCLGGLVGQNYNASISNCYSTGTVGGGDSSYYLGGLAGYNNGGNISNCYSTGDVSGMYDLGGLVGHNDSEGGISNCYSTGAVSGGSGSSGIGGLVGVNEGSISNCYSTGTVIGGAGSRLGGLVGWNYGSISNCYSTGDVSGSSYLGGLVGYNNSGTISSCYFPDTEPNNGLGTPLTDAKMKQQKSFIGWDFIGETVNGPNDIWWINKGVSYPKLYWQPNVTKCTVTAGSKVNSDKISFSGTMGASADDFNDANTVKVTINSGDIVSPCALTFPIDANTFKKGKYNYSKTANGVRKSFTYDLKTRKFAFSASNVDLSGLGCPVNVEIEIGGYYAGAEVNEMIVNGSRVPIPIKLMNGVKNVLRVDKCTVKQNNKPNKDQLTASGAFAVENPDPCMANWTTENLVITLGAQQFTIPKSNLKTGKGKFSCSNVKVTDPNATAAATFNFNLCSFTLTIKDANIPPVSGDVNFGAAFAGYNEVEEVTLP